jgi:hypothetical protein
MILRELLSQFPTQLLRLAFFLCFFAAAGVAIYFNDRTVSRQGFLALFFVFLLLSGSTGLFAWPFFNWHLYPGERSAEESFYELRVVDADGDELKYDARAAPPILATPVKRLTTQMATEYTAEQRRRMGCYLLDRARSYRAEVGEPSIGEAVKFPRHQFGFRWQPRHLDGIDRITAVRGYAVTVEVTPDGRELERYDAEPAFTVHGDECS